MSKKKWSNGLNGDDYSDDYTLNRVGDYDGTDDDYEEQMDYIYEVRSKLAHERNRLISNEEINAQLEVSGFNVNKAVKALKAATCKSATRPAPSSTVKGKVVSVPALSTKATRITELAAAAATTATVADTLQCYPNELGLSDDEEITEEGQEKNFANKKITLVVVGHVDAGKSTFVAKLLCLLGQIPSGTVSKIEKEAEQMGKGSFALAWAMDVRTAEREHGVTIDVAERPMDRKFQTSQHSFVILDTPGHRDFIPNMIRGTSQADVAILIVPAAEGEYEASMKDTAQTKEHCFLLKALGVTKIIVAVNKMDQTKPEPWSSHRYFTIEAEIKAFLEIEIHFQECQIQCVPVSGLVGENLVSVSECCGLLTWYSGSTLLEALNSCRPANLGLKHLASYPMRAVGTITGFAAAAAAAAASPTVEVEAVILQGSLHLNRSVGLSLRGSQCKVVKAVVVEIHMPNEEGILAVGVARSRDHVRVKMELVGGQELTEEDVDAEIVLFKPKVSPSLSLPLTLPVRSSSFAATVVTLPTLAAPLLPGSVFELYLKGSELQCRVKRLVSVRIPDKGLVEKPKAIGPDRTATVILELIGQPREMVMDPFKVSGALGRFALRIRGFIAAVGIIDYVYSKDELH